LANIAFATLGGMLSRSTTGLNI